MASAGKPTEILTVSASGTKGIGELASHVDPTTVSYVLCRIPIGSGSFKREKLVVLHLQMEACPPLKRGRINTKGAEVKRLLGDVNAVLQFSEPSELSLDSVLAGLSRIMSSDAGDVSIAKMKADYQAMIDAAGALGGAGGPGSKADGGIVLSRKTAIELGGVQGGAALKSVQELTGAFNWCLFKVGGGGPGASGFGGDMTFVNAGSLSVPEMVRCLPEDEVCLGLLRLGFGTGRFRRVKYVVVGYNGPKVAPVKKAKALAARAGVKAKLGAFSVEIQCNSPEELTLQAVIEKVRRSTPVDGSEVYAGGTAEDAYSMEAFLAALAEEAAASAHTFGDSGLVIDGGSGSTMSAAATIADIRKGGATNWALFTVNA